LPLLAPAAALLAVLLAVVPGLDTRHLLRLWRAAPPPPGLGAVRAARRARAPGARPGLRPAARRPEGTVARAGGGPPSAVGEGPRGAAVPGHRGRQRRLPGQPDVPRPGAPAAHQAPAQPRGAPAEPGAPGGHEPPSHRAGLPAADGGGAGRR